MADRYPLRGRSQAMEIVREGLKIAQQGEGGVVVVKGQPGIGKTRFIHESRAVADELGFLTGYGAARRGDEFVELAVFLMSICEGSQPLIDRNELAQVPMAAPEHRYWVL